MDRQATWQTAFRASIFNDVISVSVCGYSSSKVCATMRGAEKKRREEQEEEEDTTISFEPRGCCSCKRGCQKLSESSRTPQFYSPPSHLQRWQRKVDAMLCDISDSDMGKPRQLFTFIYHFAVGLLKFSITFPSSCALRRG